MPRYARALPPRPFRLPAGWRLAALALAGACAALASNAHAAINANKSFTPDVVSVGQPSTVTVFFLNANAAAATGVAFTDALPVGVVVASSPSVTTSCGGALAANAGDPSVSFSGGTIPAAVGTTPGSCSVTFNVTASIADVYINTIPAGDVTSSEGPNSQATQATLNVSALAPMGGTKAFAPTNVHGGGDPSVATITLTNSNGVALTNVSFTDTLPAQLVVSATPTPATSCGGTLTATAGAATASLAGGTVPASGSCTVTFGVVAATPNAAFNANVQNVLAAGSITTFEGVTNPTITSNTLRVQTGAQVVKAFAPTSITSGGTSTLTVTVSNFNATAMSPLGFSDPLPAGMTIAAPLTTGGTCVTANGASFSVAVVGAATYTTTGGSLPGVATNAGDHQHVVHVHDQRHGVQCEQHAGRLQQHGGRRQLRRRRLRDVEHRDAHGHQAEPDQRREIVLAAQRARRCRPTGCSRPWSSTTPPRRPRRASR